jgi:putative tryptophan/tyrosine transport system substrate-binding protein
VAGFATKARVPGI